MRTITMQKSSHYWPFVMGPALQNGHGREFFVINLNKLMKNKTKQNCRVACVIWDATTMMWLHCDITLFLLWPSLLWRHNGRGSVSNHQPHHCFLNRLFRRRSKKTSKLRVTGLCAGKSPGTGEFPAQMASNAENVSIWWRHHGLCCHCWPIKVIVESTWWFLGSSGLFY